MNKWVKGGLIAFVIILIVIVVMQMQNYVKNTYVGQDYYLQVPADQSTEVDEWQTGEYTLRGKEYKFTAYNAAGEAKVVEFSIHANTNFDETISSDELLQPNVYLKVNASPNRVIKWEIIKESDVPKAALTAIKAHR